MLVVLGEGGILVMKGIVCLIWLEDFILERMGLMVLIFWIGKCFVGIVFGFINDYFLD